MQKYKIPKIWRGQTIFILGGGPSLIGLDYCLPRLNEKGGLEAYLHDKNVIGVNNAFRFGEWVDVLAFGDAKWYWWNKEDVDQFKGLKITRNERVPERDPSVIEQLDINVVGKGQLRGFDKRPDHLAWNRSSGGMAVDLAVHLGAKIIVLVGFDMHNVNGVKNWMPHTQENTNQNPYQFQRKGFEWIAHASCERGVEILNATPNSAIKEFPFVRLEEICCRL